MRYLLLLLPFLLTACSRNVAGLTIPPNQAFVLGEYMESGYRVSLVSQVAQAVTVQLIDQATGEERSRLVLSGRGSEEVYVEPGLQVRMINDYPEPAAIRVTMNKGVAGMRLEGLDGQPVQEITAAEAAAEQQAVTVREGAGPAQRAVSSDLPAGQELIIGEGSSLNYAAVVQLGPGEGIQVSVRDKRSGRQRQGFGLGAPGKETVTVGPEEDLHVLNTGERTVRVTVALSAPVSGQRTVAIGSR